MPGVRPPKSEKVKKPKSAPAVAAGPGVLRIPDGTETVRESTFAGKNTKNVKIVVVPSFVKKMLGHAFRGWEKLSEVQFEADT